MPLLVRQDDLLMRVIKDLNDIRSSLRRVVANIPLYDISNENTPAQITSDQNNYVPGNFDVLRLSTDAPRTITGLRGGVKGRFIQLFNIGTYPITLSHRSGLSLASNQFSFATGIDNVIMPGSSIKVYYDITKSLWVEGTQLEISGLSKENSPAQITGDQNNYVVGGYEIIRLNSNAIRTITGIAGGSKGRTITLLNVGNFDIILANESVLSLEENRFTVSTGADFTLIPNGSVTLYYDFATLRWRIDDISGVLWRRQGGSSTVWYQQGTTNYTPSNAIMQGGVARIVFVAQVASAVTVTFPVAFSNPPIILLSHPYFGLDVQDYGYATVLAASFGIYMVFSLPQTLNLDVTWLAIGPR